jgi:hypothetical protein
MKTILTEVQDYFTENGCKLLETDYINSSTKFVNVKIYLILLLNISKELKDVEIVCVYLDC